MKLGLFTIGIGPGARPGAIRELARTAEQLGFSTLWAPEHAVLFDRQSSKYPYSSTGEFAAPGDFVWLDPFLSLTYAAAVTSKIRLATGICLVPEHNPLILAKKIATLDYLSGGRFALGVGIGWSQEEFAALGIPWERRVARTREYIDVMRRLWSEDRTTFHGDFVNVDGVRSYPKPVQGDQVPIIFGGESLPALKRVASYGTGWYGFNLQPDEAAVHVKKLRELVQERGRDFKKIELIVSPYTKKIEPSDLERYREAGISEVVFLFDVPSNDDEIPARLSDFFGKWLSAAARLA